MEIQEPPTFWQWKGLIKFVAVITLPSKFVTGRCTKYYIMLHYYYLSPPPVTSFTLYSLLQTFHFSAGANYPLEFTLIQILNVNNGHTHSLAHWIHIFNNMLIRWSLLLYAASSPGIPIYLILYLLYPVQKLVMFCLIPSWFCRIGT